MKTGILSTTAALLLFVPLGAQAPAPDPLWVWMDRIAQRQLDARDREVAGIRTVADVERRKKIVRARVLEALGGLPDYKGPLNARKTGEIQADGYVIEKILYESLPGYYVTANLYRPKQPGRYPAVLLQAGHTQEGKAEPQRLAANLALKGIIALAFDPSGQGEREQTFVRQTSSPAAGWSVNEHIHSGAQAAIAGEGVGRYFVWDAMRSVDYLVSRPDVDPERLGAAGCSGGGALTLFSGALDNRLKVVIPSCFPGTYRQLYASSANPHSEMTVPQILYRNLDTADFILLSAPNPWQLHATEQDFFPPSGLKPVYEEVRRWYALYGAEEKISYFVGPGPHGTPLVSREAMYEWFIRWLKDGKGDPREQRVKDYHNFELQVTETGRVEDLPGARKLHQIILESFDKKRKPGTPAELAAELKRLEIATGAPAPAVKVLSEATAEGVVTQQIEFESEPGIALKATVQAPAGAGRRPAVLLIPGRMTDLLAANLVKSGRLVMRFEPRRSARLDRSRPYVGDYQGSMRADQIGLNLAALRARDIVRAVDLLSARQDVDPADIRAVGEGVKGTTLLFAAAVDPRIRKVWLDRTPPSFRLALRNSVANALGDTVIFGFALRWDLGDLVKTMGKRQVMWTDPADWMGGVTFFGPSYQYRWVYGDLTEERAANLQDMELMRQFIN